MVSIEEKILRSDSNHDQRILRRTPYINGKKNIHYLSPSQESQVLFKEHQIDIGTLSNENHINSNKHSNNIISLKQRICYRNKSSDETSNLINKYTLHNKKTEQTEGEINQICTNCVNKEIIEQKEQSFQDEFSDYDNPLYLTEFNELNNKRSKSPIDLRIKNRKTLTNRIISMCYDNENELRKKKLQETQSSATYFMFDKNKQDHNLERARLKNEIKEKIQKNYLHSKLKEKKVYNQKSLILKKSYQKNRVINNQVEIQQSSDNTRNNYKQELMKQIELNSQKKKMMIEEEAKNERNLMLLNKKSIEENEKQQLKIKEINLKFSIENHMLDEERKKQKENEDIFNLLRNSKKTNSTIEAIAEKNQINLLRNKENFMKDFSKNLKQHINDKIEKKINEKANNEKSDEILKNDYENFLCKCYKCNKRYPGKTMKSKILK